MSRAMRLSQIEIDDADQEAAEQAICEIMTPKRTTLVELRAWARRKRVAFDDATKWITAS
jgi:hypothetical protein